MKAKCINATTSGLTKNKIYLVNIHNDNYFLVIDDYDKRVILLQNRFEIVDESNLIQVRYINNSVSDSTVSAITLNKIYYLSKGKPRSNQYYLIESDDEKKERNYLKILFDIVEESINYEIY